MSFSTIRSESYDIIFNKVVSAVYRQIMEMKLEELYLKLEGLEVNSLFRVEIVGRRLKKKKGEPQSMFTLRDQSSCPLLVA
ncbi:hypothetical protein Csa_022498 [Cucumis sativus]|uniref:Uncharacterized protein n=1 Tax=Cucumis sativus TaxID=3659 RepID=A0A0A0LSV9_CUCSA|nr:hypothetical protein Csa_022498 [Cucumis sativus]